MNRGAGPYVSTGAARYSLASILSAAPPSLARKRYIVVVSFVRIPHPPSLSSNDKSTPTRCKPRRNGATEWLVVVAAMVDRPRPRARVPFAGDINLD